MKVNRLITDRPIRSADVNLTSKDVAMLSSLLKSFIENEAQAHIDAGFGFAVEHGVQLAKDMDDLYKQLWAHINGKGAHK